MATGRQGSSPWCGKTAFLVAADGPVDPIGGVVAGLVVGEGAGSAFGHLFGRGLAVARLMEEGKLPVPENTTGFRLAIQDIETGDSAFVMVLCDDPAAHRRVPASAPPRRAESEAEFRERLSRMVAGSSATAAMRAAQADVAARQPPAEPVDLADEYRKMGLI